MAVGKTVAGRTAVLIVAFVAYFEIAAVAVDVVAAAVVAVVTFVFVFVAERLVAVVVVDYFAMLSVACLTEYRED